MQRPIWCLKRVFKVFSDLLSDHSEKVIIFCPFSCFGLKTASNNLGGQIWPFMVTIIWGQGTVFVLWYTPRICFLLWSFQLLMEKWPLMTSKWPRRPIWCLKRVFEVYSDLLSDQSEKVTIIGPFSSFGLKTTSNNLRGQIWPHAGPIILGQGAIFVFWYTPRICFLLWSFQLLMEKWPLMTSKWPRRPIWCVKRAFEVYPDLLSDHSEKVIILGPFSCFGLKTASNDLGG